MFCFTGSFGRASSLNGLGYSDGLSRTSSLGQMAGMGDNLGGVGRSDGGATRFNPMLPAFLQDDGFNPSERDKPVVSYDWVRMINARPFSLVGAAAAASVANRVSC